nr:exopolysaccharide biosynthesis protein [uncultured Gellertiella sp.]
MSDSFVPYAPHLMSPASGEGLALPCVDLPRTPPGPLSDILADLALSPQSHLSIRDMTDALGERSFGASLTVFALPNLIPLPPGSTVILGLPLLFITWQMMASARGHLWFPDRFANYRVRMTTFSAFADRAIPLLRFAERWVQPRLRVARGRMLERLLGAFALILALAVFLPVPLGNWMPALALAVIGLTLTARDGLGLIAGICLGVVSIIFVACIILATGAALACIL